MGGAGEAAELDTVGMDWRPGSGGGLKFWKAAINQSAWKVEEFLQIACPPYKAHRAFRRTCPDLLNPEKPWTDRARNARLQWNHAFRFGYIGWEQTRRENAKITDVGGI